jgi:hypothetical protein
MTPKTPTQPRPGRDKKSRAVATTAPDTAATDNTFQAIDPTLGLVPGVRERLQARLHAMGIPASRTVSYAARITQRTAQSVRRWFDPQAPGLPDLASFTRLCVGLGCCSDSLLGIDRSAAAAALSTQDTRVLADSIEAMARTLAARGGAGTPWRVPGDEMAPQLGEGDLVFVDTAQAALDGNGIYAVEYEGRRLIRRIEQRLGDRIVLKCDNPAYRDCELSAAFTRDGRLRVLGKVHAVIGLRLL